MTTRAHAGAAADAAHRIYLRRVFGCFAVAYLATVLFVHNGKMMILDREYSLWLHAKHVATSPSPERLDLVVIGDSRAKAGYIPAMTKRHTFNLSLAGQTPVEGYYLLRKYLEHHPPPEKLLISYSPIHLTSAEFFWRMTVKYGFLDYGEYAEVLAAAVRLNDNVFGETDMRWQYWFLPNMYLDSLLKAFKERRWTVNEEAYTTVANSNGQYFYGREAAATEPNPEIEQRVFAKSRVLESYLLKLIDLAQSNGSDVFWYTMPFAEISCSKLPPEFKTAFERYVADLESHKQIKVLEKIACWPNDLFGDSHHVYRGARNTTLGILTGVFGASARNG